MSSQEEYLDQLLKDMLDGDRAEQDAPGHFDAVFSDHGGALERKERYELDDLDKLSLEDVNQILEENSKSVKSGEDLSSLELDELLKKSGEEGLLEIQDILQKADNNEPVDDCIVYMIEKAEESSDEIPEDILEQMQEEGECGKLDENSGFLGKILGKKKKETSKPQNSRRKSDDFEFETIMQNNDLQLIDGDEKNKGWFEKLKSKILGKVKKSKEEKEDQKAAGKKTAEKAGDLKGKVSQKKKGKKIDEALKEITKEPEIENHEDANVLSDEVDQLLNGLGDDSGLGGIVEESLGDESAEGKDIEERSEILEEDLGDGGTESSQVTETTDGDKVEIEDADALNPEGNKADAQDLIGIDGLEGINDLDATDLAGISDLGESDNLDELLKIVEKGDKKEKKKGLFAKILEFLTEEDEEEKKEEDGLILSDENDAILKELDQEKGNKKKKKPKKGKGKEEGDEEEDGADKKGKKKAKKEKKPKKEKEPKLKEVEEPGKKLSKRRVTLIFLVCLAIGGAFLVLSNVTIDFSEKKKAQTAFLAGDYEDCYQNLVGKKLTESEQVMFGKSESILRIRLWKREYEVLAEQGQEAEALDSLIQSVHDYPTLYAFSGKWNAVSDVQVVFDQMLEILRSKYGLTEEEAKIIAYEEDDLLYSKMIRTIAGGGVFGDWENGDIFDPQTENDQQNPLQGGDEDLLPEEEDLKEIPFAD